MEFAKIAETYNQETFRVIKELLRTNIEKAFLVCDTDDIVRKYRHWITAMPRIKPFYAVKCNPHPVVLKCLAALGVGFDCATKHEIEDILNLGVSPNDIIFANPIKDISHIRYANLNGVSYTTFDSLSELQKCKKSYPIARHLIRIKANASSALCTFDNKFGCDPYTEAYLLLEAAKKLKVDVVGVAFHVGTGCKDPYSFRTAIRAAKYVFNVAHTIGFNFHLLDIGGGFLAYNSKTIYEMADVINNSLEKYFPDNDVQIISEPGRFFVRSAFTLASRVLSVRPSNLSDNDMDRKYLYCIDNGIYGLFYKVTLGDHVTPIPWKRSSSKKYSSTVFGPTMSPVDIVAEDVHLPKLRVDDWLVFPNMGDYTIAIQTQFHGFKPPYVFLTTKNYEK